MEPLNIGDYVLTASGLTGKVILLSDTLALIEFDDLTSIRAFPYAVDEVTKIPPPTPQENKFPTT